MAKVVISAGHGKYVSGAVGNGYTEHVEAAKVVKRVVEILGKEAIAYYDKTSKTQRDNLNNIVNYHNKQSRLLDVSIHLNSGGGTGSECLYYDAKSLSAKMSKAMADALGMQDRGAKIRQELYFLNATHKPAILLELCFIDSKSDMAAYKKNFEKLCQAIAKVIAAQVGIKINSGSTTSKPKPPTTGSNTHKDEVYHIVQPGESLWAIGKAHNLTVDQVKKLNPQLKSNVIYKGDKIRVK